MAHLSFFVHHKEQVKQIKRKKKKLEFARSRFIFIFPLSLGRKGATMAARVIAYRMLSIERSLLSPFLKPNGRSPPAVNIFPSGRARIESGSIRCAASESTDGKVSARLSLMKQVLKDAEERSLSAGAEQVPKVTLGKDSSSTKNIQTCLLSSLIVCIAFRDSDLVVGKNNLFL